MCVTANVKDVQYLLAGFDSNDMKYSCILYHVISCPGREVKIRGQIGSKIINIL